MVSSWSGSRPAAARPPSWLSRCWSKGMGRWSCACAGGCWPTRMTARMPFRPPSSFWSRRPGGSGCAILGSVAPSGRLSHRVVCPVGRRPTAAGTNRSRQCSRKEARVEADDDLERVLHEEIERLPERYRAPLVLCDLEGCTHEQAARHLGWPVGTVKSRQARGRERLRDGCAAAASRPMAAVLAAALRPDGASVSGPSRPGRFHDQGRDSICRSSGDRPGSAALLAQGVLIHVRSHNG